MRRPLTLLSLLFLPVLGCASESLDVGQNPGAGQAGAAGTAGQAGAAGRAGQAGAAGSQPGQGGSASGSAGQTGAGQAGAAGSGASGQSGAGGAGAGGAGQAGAGAAGGGGAGAAGGGTGGQGAGQGGAGQAGGAQAGSGGAVDCASAPEGTVVSATDPHDCVHLVCKAGKPSTVPDDTEAPTSPNDCTQATCAGGKPIFSFVVAQTPCAGEAGSVCDGAGHCGTCKDGASECAGDVRRVCQGGQFVIDPCPGSAPYCNAGSCVACLQPSHCPAPPEPACATATCQGFVCGVSFVGAGTQAGAQTPGDCQSMVCDGSGALGPVDDDGDAPASSNPCVESFCSGGKPQTASSAVGTACGTGQSCDGQGSCVSGPVCGDHQRTGNEACDGSDLGGVTCVSLLGFQAVGAPTCTAQCTLDTSSCAVAAPSPCPNSEGLQTAAPWPMLGVCPTQPNRSPYAGPSSDNFLWSKEVTQEDVPIIAADGTIYISSGGLTALTPDGEKKWDYNTGTSMGGTGRNSAAIGVDGTVYFVSNGTLIAVNPDGSVKWQSSASNLFSSPMVAPSGDIFLGTYSGLAQLHADGTSGWVVTLGKSVYGGVVLNNVDELVIDTWEPRVRSYTQGGSSLWVSPQPFDTQNVYGESPAMGLGSLVYAIHTFDLVAVKAGTEQWRIPVPGGYSHGAPAVTQAGSVVVGSDTGLLTLFTSSGSKVWSTQLGGAFLSTPTIGADGVIYVSDFDGWVYAVSSSGSKLWSHWLGQNRAKQPVIAANGTLYVVADPPAGEAYPRLHAFGK